MGAGIHFVLESAFLDSLLVFLLFERLGRERMPGFYALESARLGTICRRDESRVRHV